MTGNLELESVRAKTEFCPESNRTSRRTKRRAVRTAKVFLSFIIVGICVLAPRISAQTVPPSKRIVIAASTVLDGHGRVLRDVRLVIEGSKIVAIDPQAGPADYDLRGLTVLPGWIDAHVHITWIFGRDGKNAATEGTTQADEDSRKNGEPTDSSFRCGGHSCNSFPAR
jgi:hypothetical protein